VNDVKVLDALNPHFERWRRPTVDLAVAGFWAR
jgi:hypothetical protein